MEVTALFRQSENRARAELGVPLIGEGWVSETHVYKQIHAALPGFDVVPHGRPWFLGLQHFDVWIPALNVAVEFHGTQHFEPVELFGGAEGLAKTQARDARKRQLAQEHQVTLIEMTALDDLPAVINRIKHAVK